MIAASAMHHRLRILMQLLLHVSHKLRRQLLLVYYKWTLRTLLRHDWVRTGIASLDTVALLSCSLITCQEVLNRLVIFESFNGATFNGGSTTILTCPVVCARM